MDEQTCMQNCKLLHDLHAKVEGEAMGNQAEHGSFKRRLSDLEESSKRQGEILIVLQKQGDAIERIDGKLDRVSNSVDRIDKRVDEIEREPSEHWKKIVFEVIKYVVVAVIGAGLMYAFKI